MSAPSGRRLVVVDSRVPDLVTLVGGALPGHEVHVLPVDRDGLGCIAGMLARERAGSLATLSVVSHGGAGRLQLGAGWLDAAGIEARTRALATIRRALAPEAAVLLYGCEVGAGAVGLRFLDVLSRALGGVEVAAASGPVGAARLGGGWDLGVGACRSAGASPFTAATRTAYAGLLMSTPPSAVLPGAAYAAQEGVAITLKGTGLSVADPDAGTGIETAVLSVGEGTLVASAGDSGATVLGSGSSTVQITGTVAQINALLGSGGTSTLTYTDTAAVPAGSVPLTLRITERPTTGVPLTGSASGSITVAATDDAPSFWFGDGTVVTPVGSSRDEAQSVAVQPDGKILLGGVSTTGSNSDFALVRYNADGSLDTSFGGTGKVTTPIGSANDGGTSVAVQPDGKVLLGGYSYNGSSIKFALVRYNADGTLDTSFGGSGKVTTSVGSIVDYGNSVTVQPDGKILLGGYSHNGSNSAFALVRYNANGTLDTSFRGTGKVTTSIGSFDSGGTSVTLQPDGKILLGGYSDNGTDNDFALVRYNTDGTLDTSFGGTGKVTTSIGSFDSGGTSVTVQPDGKILLGGYSYNGTDNDFALVRYNADGTLDTSFGGTGKITTPIGSSNDGGTSVTVQPNGKILLGGHSSGGSDDFALVRYNADGTLDTSFGGTGKVTTPIGSSDDGGTSVTVQSDGKILLGGYSYNGSDNDFALVRYNADGTLDTTFHRANTLDGAPSFTENGTAVVLDGNVQVYDAELHVAGSYAGATLTLARSGGASSDDLFGASGTLAALTEGGALTVGGVTVGTVTQNGGGTLVLTFSGAGATEARVAAVLQKITYRNGSHDPPASADIAWTFSDGNTGAQGSGGAKIASGHTVVAITAVNDAPVLAGDLAIALPQGGTVTLATADLSASDPDAGASQLVFTVTATSHGTVVLNGQDLALGGTFTQADLAAGRVGFRRDGGTDPSAGFTVSLTDGSAAPQSATIAASLDVPPAVTGIAYGSNDGTLKAGETVTFTVTASEAVTVSGTPVLQLNDGGTASYVSGSGNALLVFSHIVGAGQNAADLAVTGISGGQIRDAGGQDLVALQAGGINPAGTLAVDTVAPGVTGIVPSTTGPTHAATLTQSVTFSEAVTGVDASDFVVTATGTATARIASVAGAGTSYTVTLDQVAGDGTIRLDLKGSGTGIADTAGNEAPAFTGGGTTSVDHTAPATPIVALASDTGVDGDRITSNPAISYTAPAAGGTLLYAKDGSAYSTTVPTFATDGSADGTHTVSVIERNAAGTVSAATVFTFVLDTTADVAADPTSAAGRSEGGARASLAVDATDNGRVDRYESRTVSFSVAGLDADAHATASFTDGTHTASVAIAANGGFTVDLSGLSGAVASSLAITDLAGNAATVVGSTIVIDTHADGPLFGTMVHDASTTAGELVGLYQGLLGRAPDMLGIESWLQAVAKGATLPQVAQAILESDEYTALHGTVSGASDAGFVESLYDVVLGRAPDAAGFAFWTNALAHGTSRGQVALDLSISAENLGQHAAMLSEGVPVPDPVASDVARLYHGILDRAPDPSGLQFWTNAMKAGTSEVAVAQSFLGSSEYTAAFGSSSDAAFVIALYAGALGRSPDAAGESSWQEALAQHGHAAVAVAISESPEARIHHLAEIELGWHLA